VARQAQSNQLSAKLSVKQVETIAVQEPGRWLVITVIAKYF
jgi:hypothetical protein